MTLEASIGSERHAPLVPWLFLLAIGAALLMTGLAVAVALWMDEGHLVYLTDDPGIHLSIVNNLVHHGIFDRGFLPNSIITKSNVATESGLHAYVTPPTDLVSALQRDPLVLACTLVVVGVYLGFQIVAEISNPQFLTAAKVSLVLVILALSISRIELTIDAPRASSNTYRQRYQLGRFFEREYAGRAVATTELGYPSLFHDGPIFDPLGIGSHEALDIVQGPGWTPERLAEVLDARRAQVLAVLSEYPISPKGWIPVGVWVLGERIVPGPYGRNLVFLAPRGAAADELRRRLQRFEPRLPRRVAVLYPRPPVATGTAMATE